MQTFDPNQNTQRESSQGTEEPQDGSRVPDEEGDPSEDANPGDPPAVPLREPLGPKDPMEDPRLPAQPPHSPGV